jgi:hypothetical protein
MIGDDEPSLVTDSPDSNVSSSLANAAVRAVTLGAEAHISSDTAKELVATLHKLVHENATLHDLVQDATRRLQQLEEDKSRFFDEDVFTILNSLCNSSSGEPDANSQNLLAHLQGLGDPNLRPNIPLQLGLPWEDGAGKTADASARATTLREENAKLRRELSAASEQHERLEQQKRDAEDREHRLEQERLKLADTLTQCMASVSAGNSQRAEQPLDGGTGASNCGSITSFNDFGALAEISSMLHTELGAQTSARYQTPTRMETKASRLQLAGFPNSDSEPTANTSMDMTSDSLVDTKSRRQDIEKAALEKERMMLEEVKSKLSKERCQTEDHHSNVGHRESRLTLLGSEEDWDFRPTLSFAEDYKMEYSLNENAPEPIDIEDAY